MKQPPGFQLLHCLDSSFEGGESFFCDSFAAAKELYEDNNEGKRFFRVLAKFPVAYHYNQPERAFYDEKVTIELERKQKDVCSAFLISPVDQPASCPKLVRIKLTNAFSAMNIPFDHHLCLRSRI